MTTKPTPPPNPDQLHLREVAVSLQSLGRALGALKPSVRADQERLQELVGRRQPTTSDMVEAQACLTRLLGALQEHSHAILLASDRVLSTAARTPVR